MAKMGTQAATDANNDYSSWQKSALNGYNSGMDAYTSNVNSQIAAGSPYKSQQYLTNQNVLTSGAMNSTNDAATQQLRDTALRTGTNTAAVAGEVGRNAQQKQMDLTNYNAGRDTANEDKWLMQRQQLTQDQLAGANSEAGVYGTSSSGRSNATTNLADLQKGEMEDWTKVGTNAMQGLGTGLTAAFA